MSPLEEGVAKVEEIRTRLNHLESRINWLLGVLITMWVTIILTIIFT